VAWATSDEERPGASGPFKEAAPQTDHSGAPSGAPHSRERTRARPEGYRASIDYAKLVDRLPDASQATRDALSKLGTVPADVWIDGQEPGREDAHDHRRPRVRSRRGHGRADDALSDFGVPVDVEAPTRGSDRRLLGAHQRRDMTGAVERDVRRAHRTHDV
jgi:hypothetical protein